MKCKESNLNAGENQLITASVGGTQNEISSTAVKVYIPFTFNDSSKNKQSVDEPIQIGQTENSNSCLEEFSYTQNTNQVF